MLFGSFGRLLQGNHIVTQDLGAKSYHLLWITVPFYLIFFLVFLLLSLFFNFTILYWFCHTSKCICHGCTRVPHPEPPSHLLPHTIPLSSQCTSPKLLVSCIEPGLAIHFLYDIIHVSMPFSLLEYRF